MRRRADSIPEPIGRQTGDGAEGHMCRWIRLKDAGPSPFRQLITNTLDGNWRGIRGETGAAGNGALERKARGFVARF